MSERRPFVMSVGLLSLLLATSSLAHVTVWPRESTAGTFEKYVVRVPTEGRIATVSVELRLPEGLSLVSMGAPQGFRYELKKTGDRTTAVVWTQRIEPGEFAEFAFMARNPASEAGLVWKAVQTFTDGSTTEWVGPAGDGHPASVTTLKPAAPAAKTPAPAAQHQH